MDLQEIKKLMRWSDKQRPEISALLVKAEQAEQGWATASAACNRVAGERDRLTSELAAAKEEIVQLKAEKEDMRQHCIHCIDDPDGALCQAVSMLDAAESSLASERKETERLRGALQKIMVTPVFREGG